MPVPLAYFLTWHTYGSRLHGNVKGSVDYEHRDISTPVLPPDPKREAESQARMKTDTVQLDHAMRQAVVDQVLETCGFRHWQLLAIHARTTHVHAVVVAHAPVEKVLADLKAYATRRLRTHKLIQTNRPLWSEHGSTRYLWKPDAVSQKIHYTLHEQGQPMARWPIESEHEA